MSDEEVVDTRWDGLPVTSASMVSISVVALNEEQRLPTLLASIDQQRGSDVPFEVILIDNGSTDGTWQIMRRYRDAHELVRVFRHQGTLGSARNLALRAARGDYVAFLDADMVLPKNWLSAAVKLVEKHSCDALVARLVPFFRHGGPLNDYVRAYHLGDTGTDGLWPECVFHGGGLVVRRDRALRVWFRSDLPASEDGEFSYRFQRQGFTVRYFPSAHFVLDEQYYDLRGLLSYYRKLAIAGVLLLRSAGSAEVARHMLRALAEPLTPHYLVIRYRKASRSVKTSFLTWLLAGLARLVTMASVTWLYGPLGWPIPARVQRKKT